jgi:hypothetical protein
MRKTSLAVLFAVVTAALTLTAYAAAAAKSYQFTGVVKTVEGGTFTVQKSASETWEFSTDASTKGTPKVGDKVTVQYRMIATSIDSKAAAGTAATTTPAPASTDKPAAPAAKKK